MRVGECITYGVDVARWHEGKGCGSEPRPITQHCDPPTTPPPPLRNAPTRPIPAPTALQPYNPAALLPYCLCAPRLTPEAVLVADIVDEKDSIGSSVIRRRDRAEAFLPRRVPHLELYGLVADLDRLDLKVDAYRRAGSKM